jgi:Tol biopolymer transport system component
MGEVYLAEDTRLRRRVALKVLGSTVAGDSDARYRLIQEARSAATLDHANICTVFDVGDIDGQVYIAMQYVEGETLDLVIQGGALDLDTTIGIARQVAEALAEAHDHGIVHRDIKPQNVMITRQHQVRVLDFGLAKLTSTAQSQAETAPRLTATGVVSGTLPYMSPEQLRGEPVDFRSDIFSFGTMLYEMVVKSHPFRAVSAAETTAAILTRNPVIPASAGPLAPIIRRCLEKDRNRRYQSTRDLVVDLSDLPHRESPITSAPRGFPWRWVWVAAGVALAAAAALVWHETQGAITAPAAGSIVQLTDFPDSASAPVLSHDGRMVAFLRGSSYFLGSGDVYVKSLPNGEPVRLTNDVRLKYAPAFSPDDQRVSFTLLDVESADRSQGWETWTVPVTGASPPSRLLPNAAGMSWIDDRHVLFSEIAEGTFLHMGLVAATESRADKRVIYFPEHERAMAHYSYLSPDRKSVLVVEMTRTGAFGPCKLVSFDGTSPVRDVGPPGACLVAAWSPNGQWMYFSATVGGTHIWRQRFPNGSPELMSFGPGMEEQGVAIAADGKSLVTAMGRRQSSIWIHESAGDRLLSSEGDATMPRLSRDGKRLYFLLRRTPTSSVELQQMDLGTGKLDRLVPEHDVIDFDVSPDESTVAFTTPGADGASEIWVAARDRHSAPHLVVRGGDQVGFGPDGDLLFRALEGKVNYLDRVSQSGSGRRRLLTMPIYHLSGLSPDGQWKIATLGPSGDLDAVPTSGGAPRPICSYGCDVQWSADGRWFYGTMTMGFEARETVAVPLRPGEVFPEVDGPAVSPPDTWLQRAGAIKVEHAGIQPELDPGVYVFTKTTVLQNLFRVPIS